VPAWRRTTGLIWDLPNDQGRARSPHCPRGYRMHHDQQRVSGAAAGAGAGVLVAGPVGAVAGGAAGAIYGPGVSRSARRAMR
jgi:hypothetical protein